MFHFLYIYNGKSVLQQARKHPSGHLHAEIKTTVNSMPNNDYKKGIKTESRNQYTSYALSKLSII
jgi:hypothetical protein